jgi:hypothetical protein
MATKHLVLWGHNLADFKEMFSLTADELNQPILDCYSGPASFNAQMHQQGKKVISVDKLYGLEHDPLIKEIDQYFQSMLQQVHTNQEHFVWEKIATVDALAQERQHGIETFLQDFPHGKLERRYRGEDLSKLPFTDFQFKLALSSHYLFNYRGKQTVEENVAGILEMCRVAEEVRIFPLLDYNGETSILLGPVMLALQEHGIGMEVKEVPYQFQKNSCAMLRAWSLSCDIN